MVSRVIGRERDGNNLGVEREIDKERNKWRDKREGKL